MWLSFNDAFISIVQPSADDLKKHPETLVVRARRPGDIEAVFGEAAGTVEKRPERDYLFRVFIEREIVSMGVAQRVMGIGYGNFKDSVRDHNLHDAYARVWGVMAGLQPIRPYSGRHDPTMG
jgi:hypothetical protein